jgi:hypothetical protein
MDFWLRWFGVPVGAISMFSLVQKLYGFGLAPVFEDIVSFYHAVLHPIANAITSELRWLLSLVHINVPEIPPDIVVIWCLLGSSAFRFTAYDINTDSDPETANIESCTILKLANRLMHLVRVLIFWPFGLILIIRSLLIDNVQDKLRNMITLAGWALETTKVIVAFLIIFAINAYSA